MKVARTYTLEQEIVAKLKTEENASALIERLLSQHFEMTRKRSPEEIRQEIAIKKIELDAMKKIEAIKK